LLHIYDHLNYITKQINRRFLISPYKFITVLKFPKSTLNFLHDKKVPMIQLEEFRKEIN
jgi:hypothetical protein